MGLSHAGGEGLRAGKTALIRRRENAESTLEISLGLPEAAQLWSILLSMKTAKIETA